MSDVEITRDLMTRLRRHYIKPGERGMQGGVFVEECGLNGAAERRCDALYVGFTSASGRMLVGHEVKASRSDWLTELNHPGKADRWADQCHQWWLVTAPGVVQDGELPAGWGHMVPGKSKTRMQVVTKAATHLDRQPSWLIVRSLIARLDTLTANEVRGIRTTAAREARDEANKRDAQRAERAMPHETRLRLDALATIEQTLGCSVTEWRHPQHVSPSDFARAVALLSKTDDLTGRYMSLESMASRLSAMAEQLNHLHSEAKAVAS